VVVKAVEFQALNPASIGFAAQTLARFAAQTLARFAARSIIQTLTRFAA
jgi:hypothetical protein